MVSFTTGQRVQVRDSPRRKRCGTIVATLRDNTYLVDLLPQAEALPDAEQPASAEASLESEYAEVRRYPGERLLRLRSRA
jgi:hypothetical protein